MANKIPLTIDLGMVQRMQAEDAMLVPSGVINAPGNLSLQPGVAGQLALHMNQWPTAAGAVGNALKVKDVGGGLEWGDVGDVQAITANTTLHVSPLGDDATGDGSGGSPWATIGRALAYLKDKWITVDAMVTIKLADGTHVYNDTIEYSCPFGHRVEIVGTTTYSINLSSVGAIAGASPDRTIVLNVSSTANCEVGDIIRIDSASGGSFAGMLPGASRITAINSATQMVVSFPNRNTRATIQPSGNIIGTITVFKTKIYLNACHGLYIWDGSMLSNLDKVAFEGTHTTDKYAISVGEAPGGSGSGYLKCGTQVAIWNAWIGVIAQWGGKISAQQVAVGKCTHGYLAQYGAYIDARASRSNGNDAYGYAALYGGSVRATLAISTGNGQMGVIAMFFAMIDMSGGLSWGNIYHGATGISFGGVVADNANTSYNELNGCNATFGSFLNGDHTTSSNNQGIGILSSQQSAVYAGYATVNNNVGGGIKVENNAYIDRRNATASGNTGFQTSPTAGATPVVGNYEGTLW